MNLDSQKRQQLNELFALTPHASALAEKFRPPHFIDGFVGVLQNVELVIHDPAVHCPLGNTVSEWAPHIHARRRDALPLVALSCVRKNSSTVSCLRCCPNHKGRCSA
jgi:hypothetical protein